MRKDKTETTRTWFEGNFTWRLILLLSGLLIFLAKILSPTTRGSYISVIADIIDTVGATLLGSVALSHIIGHSSFKEDCMDAASNIIADKNLSRFSNNEISEFYAAAIKFYLFRENEFSSTDTEFLLDVSMMEDSLTQTFRALHKQSIYMRKSFQNIVITLDDNGASIQAERVELYCMPIGTDFTYKRVISAMANTSANTYQIKSVEYNGEFLTENEYMLDKSNSEYDQKIYHAYKTVSVLSWKFDSRKLDHLVKVRTEYRAPSYDVFISYHLKYYCAMTEFESTLIDNRKNKNIKFRIATEVFSPAIINSRSMEAKPAEHFSEMNSRQSASNTEKFCTPSGTWMPPGSGYAISLDVVGVD